MKENHSRKNLSQFEARCLMLKDVKSQVRAMCKELIPVQRVRIDTYCPEDERSGCPALRICGSDLPYAELLLAVERMAKCAGYPYVSIGWNDNGDDVVHMLGFDFCADRPAYYRSARNLTRLITCFREFNRECALLADQIRSRLRFVTTGGVDGCCKVDVSFDPDSRLGLIRIRIQKKVLQHDNRAFADELISIVFDVINDNSLSKITACLEKSSRYLTYDFVLFRNRTIPPTHPYLIVHEKKERMLKIRRRV